MNTGHPYVPYGLMAFGVIYIAKPDIFYVWMARRDASGQQRPMPEKNRTFMRRLGLVFVVVGLAILMRSAQW